MTRRTATTQPAARGATAAWRAGPRTPKGAVRPAFLTTAALAALLVTGCSTTSPATADSAGGTDLDASCSATKTDAGREITLKVRPCPVKGGGSAGTATITVKDTTGEAVEGAEVEIAPEMPNMKMKSGNQSASAKGGGYEAKLVLGMPGDWRVTVTVTPASGKASSAAFDVKAK